jgi:hypothetical protein
LSPIRRQATAREKISKGDSPSISNTDRRAMLHLSLPMEVLLPAGWRAYPYHNVVAPSDFCLEEAWIESEGTFWRPIHSPWKAGSRRRAGPIDPSAGPPSRSRCSPRNRKTPTSAPSPSPGKAGKSGKNGPIDPRAVGPYAWIEPGAILGPSWVPGISAWSDTPQAAKSPGRAGPSPARPHPSARAVKEPTPAR